MNRGGHNVRGNFQYKQQSNRGEYNNYDRGREYDQNYDYEYNSHPGPRDPHRNYAANPGANRGRDSLRFENRQRYHPYQNRYEQDRRYNRDDHQYQGYKSPPPPTQHYSRPTTTTSPPFRHTTPSHPQDWDMSRPINDHFLDHNYNPEPHTNVSNSFNRDIDSATDTELSKDQKLTNINSISNATIIPQASTRSVPSSPTLQLSPKADSLKEVTNKEKIKQRQEKLVAWKKKKEEETNASTGIETTTQTQPKKASLMKFTAKAQVKKVSTLKKPLIKAALANKLAIEGYDDTVTKPKSMFSLGLKVGQKKESDAVEDTDVDSFISSLEDDKINSTEPSKSDMIDSDSDDVPSNINFEEEEDELEGTEEQDATKLLRSINEKNKKTIPEHPPSTTPFTREFYKESEFIKDLTNEEVESLRIRDGISIRGKHAMKPVLTWSQVGLPSSILSVIESLNFEAPTTIQCEALPNIMSGNDLIGIAKTGSGKTLAFLLPLFRQIVSNGNQSNHLNGRSVPKALIMSPTRELALQIFKECSAFLEKLNLKGCCCYGGQPISQQIAELKKGCDLIVCTPGRLIDLLCVNSGRVLALTHINYLVLDEADRMFDMGFEPQVMKIVKATRPDRQTVLFSATFPPKMEALARKILYKPVEILVGSKNLVNDKIDQKFEILKDSSLKFNKLLQILGQFSEHDSTGKIIIFVDRQDGCDELATQLIARGYPSMSLHGGKEQLDRASTISDFKNGVIDILVATSVASRGLDVNDLNLVVNYDSPSHMEDYIHRVGRTGRAGNSGTSVTMITEDQDRSANDIVRLLELSGLAPPDQLADLAKKFKDKLNKGSVKFSSGFGGKGLEKLQIIRDQKQKIEKTLYDKGEEDPDDKPKNGEEKSEADEEAAVNDIQLADFKVVYGMAEKGPDSSLFHAKLNINDLSQSTRWAVSNRDNISRIVELTATSITGKGRYYPPGKEPGDNDDPKLYLLIEGETEYNVKTAVDLFKESLIKGLTAHIKEDKNKKFTIS